ncbi:MAG: hypothetical protein Tsb0016_19430 [Sphingomonadales bacterium]
MLKFQGLIERRSDMDLDAFSQYWRTTHKQHALALVKPGIMRGYVQNHRIAHDIPGLAIATDGVPELWIETMEDAQRLGQCPEYLEGAYLDEPNFMEGRSRLVTSPLPVASGSRGRKEAVGLVKFMLFVNKAHGLSDDGFGRWRDLKHPLLMPEALPLRLERETALLQVPDELPNAFAGVESSWWPDLAAFDAAWAGRVDSVARDYADIDSLSGLLVREEPVLWPDPRYL